MKYKPVSITLIMRSDFVIHCINVSCGITNSHASFWFLKVCLLWSELKDLFVRLGSSAALYEYNLSTSKENNCLKPEIYICICCFQTTLCMSLVRYFVWFTLWWQCCPCIFRMWLYDQWYQTVKQCTEVLVNLLEFRDQKQPNASSYPEFIKFRIE